MATKRKQEVDTSAMLEVPLPAQDIGAYVFRALAGFRASMAAAEPTVIADVDIEALHDFRVALRRTRTVLAILPRDDPHSIIGCHGKAFAALARATGPRRDLDLAIAELERAEEAFAAEHGNVDALREALRRRRASAQHRLLRRLGGQPHRRQLQAWERFVSAQTGDPARGVILRGDVDTAIVRAWCRVRRHASEIGARAKFRQLHRLRKEVKALRYLLEIFIDLYGQRRVAPVITELKRLQDALGEVCDIRAQRDIVEDILKGAPASLAKPSQHWKSRLRRRERQAKKACAKPAARLLSKAASKLSLLAVGIDSDAQTREVRAQSVG